MNDQPKHTRRRHKGPSLTAHLALNPGDRLTLTLGALDGDGETVVMVEGAPVSVAGGLPGEQVIAEVIRVFPERVAAKVVDVVVAAPDRVQPPCPYYLSCTGCQLQHVSYQRQLEIKRELVAQELAKHAGLAGVLVLPTLPSPRQLSYRNHARFTVTKAGPGAGEVGFVSATTRRSLRIDRCLLMDDRINSALTAMQSRLKGMSQLSVRVGEPGAGPDSMLIQPRLIDPAVPLQSGQTHVVEEVLGRRFRVAGSSFFQVNTEQLANVVSLLTSRLALTGAETVVDAYCGVGTFAVLLAPYARRVIGIEDSASAVDDARANATGLANVEFIQGRAEDVLAGLTETVDAVVLDPPRAGCHPGTLDSVCLLRPRRLALVSCEPVSLARDLARLCVGPFILESVQPVDMFPQTRHVEAVGFLRLA